MLYCFVNRKTGKRGKGMPLEELIVMTSQDDSKSYARVFEAWCGTNREIPDVDEDGNVNEAQAKAIEDRFRADFVNAWNFHDEDYKIIRTKEI